MEQERLFYITCRQCGEDAILRVHETGQGNTCRPCQALVIEEIELEHGPSPEPIRDVTGLDGPGIRRIINREDVLGETDTVSPSPLVSGVFVAYAKDAIVTS